MENDINLLKKVLYDTLKTLEQQTAENMKTKEEFINQIFATKILLGDLIQTIREDDPNLFNKLIAQTDNTKQANLHKDLKRAYEDLLVTALGIK